jgi:hypothetical protein
MIVKPIVAILPCCSAAEQGASATAAIKITHAFRFRPSYGQQLDMITCPFIILARAKVVFTDKSPVQPAAPWEQRQKHTAGPRKAA